jgi:transcription termination factor NusB
MSKEHKSQPADTAQPEEAQSGKTYTDWQQRVLSEQAELDAKIENLREFIGAKEFDKLEQTDQDLLRRQLNVMTAYTVTLGQRIARF